MGSVSVASVSFRSARKVKDKIRKRARFLQNGRQGDGRSYTSFGFLISSVWLALVLIGAIFPNVIARQDPLANNISEKLQRPSFSHWFGTDQLGRDLFSRVVHGSTLTLQAVLLATAISFVVGVTLGIVSGFWGGWVDAVIMRGVDILLSIPRLLLALAVVVALGFGTVKIAVAVGITTIASIARVARSQTLQIRELPYIEAAKAGGARTLHVLLAYMLPNALGPVIVLSVLEFGSIILSVASLSFLGYGATPPTPEWGALVADGRNYLAAQGWLTFFPGVVITLTVLASNRIATTLNERSRTI